MPACTMAVVSGSPPPAWGRQAQLFQLLGIHRFTPTRVGTTRSGAVSTSTASVHPHPRGDAAACFAEWSPGHGSPPRPWGQQPCRRHAHVYVRFTPTHVGTTPSSARMTRSAPVHPHLRGDDQGSACAPLCNCGSPPRAWGRELVAAILTQHRRFTPTRVGTTGTSRRPARRWAVHPHARGDDTLPSLACPQGCGSPPHAWGRH